MTIQNTSASSGGDGVIVIRIDKGASLGRAGALEGALELVLEADGVVS
jgi:hypothetical protein